MLTDGYCALKEAEMGRRVVKRARGAVRWPCRRQAITLSRADAGKYFSLRDFWLAVSHAQAEEVEIRQEPDACATALSMRGRVVPPTSRRSERHDAVVCLSSG